MRPPLPGLVASSFDEKLVPMTHIGRYRQDARNDTLAQNWTVRFTKIELPGADQTTLTR